MNLSCVQASTSVIFIKLYGISELEAGLVYLPSGIGSIIGAYGAGEKMSMKTFVLSSLIYSNLLIYQIK